LVAVKLVLSRRGWGRTYQTFRLAKGRIEALRGERGLVRR